MAVVSAGDKPNQLKVTTTQNLKAGEKLTIKLTNVKDFANNYTSSNPLTVTTTVVEDVAAPTVVSAEVEGEASVKVTFDKNIDNSQASTLGSKVRLISSNGKVAGTFKNAAEVDGKTVIFELDAPSFNKDGEIAGTFYLDEGIKDTLGNESKGLFSKKVTFIKDTVAPLVASVVYKENSIVLEYTEKVVVENGTVLTFINKATGKVSTVTVDTADEATDGKTTLSKDGKTVTIANHGLADGTYEVRIPAAFVVDTAGEPNESAYFTTTLDIKATVADENDTEAPTVTFTTEGDPAEVVVTTTDSEYQFSFDLSDNVGIDFNSVLNVANYTYDGKALPANSYVTTDATDNKDKDIEVTVHVPKTSVPTTVEGGLFSVVNVKDASGNGLAAVVSAAVTLIDGVAPELKTATIATTDKSVLILEFTEEVENLEHATDLELIIDGSTVVVSNIEKVTLGTDKGKYYVQGTGITDFTAKSTITIALVEDKTEVTGTAVTDAAGNKAVFGKVITVK